MIKAIIFDFDGVIVESVGVKTDAFRQLFADYPEHIDRIIDYHMEHGGVSRYKKFEYIYREIIKKPLTDGKSKELGDLFTQYSHQKVIEAPFVCGAKEFLNDNYQSLSLFVASGTPQDEMDSVISQMNLNKYFKEVYGSPKTKFEITAEILKKYNLKQDEVIFVGDAITDYDGAKEAGVCFIGRIHKIYDNPFKNVNPDFLIDDLTGLKTLIEEKSYV